MSDETLWCLHVVGPDSVIPMPDKATAEAQAAKVNEFWEAYQKFPTFDPEFSPKFSGEVIPWPWAPERHAEQLPEIVDDIKHNRLDWT